MTKKQYLNYYALRLFFRITDSFASFAERKSQTIRLTAIFFTERTAIYTFLCGLLWLRPAKISCSIM